MSKQNLADLREHYTKGGIVEENLPDDPISLLKQWLEEAVHAGALEPNAMSLATVSVAGTPNVRTVLLKGIEGRSVSFFTNYKSRKAGELAANPAAACSIWWPELERQIRFRGKVEKLPEEISEEYFQSRPRESRIGAWASEQSRPVESRQELEKRFADLEKQFDGKPVPRPAYWGGYRIKIDEIEFWQGRPGRMHDRIEYLLEAGTWKRQRLAP